MESVEDFKSAAGLALEKHAHYEKINHQVLGHFVQELPKYMDPYKILFEESDVVKFAGSDAKMIKRILQDLDQNKIKRMDVLFARLKMRIEDVTKSFLESDTYKNEILNLASSHQDLIIPGWGKTSDETLENTKVFLAMKIRSRIELGQTAEEAYTLSQRALRKYLSQWNPQKPGNQIFEIMSKSFVSGLDPFSRYMTREEMMADATELPQRFLAGFKMTDSLRGFLVTDVQSSSPAELAGILKGDVVTAIQGTKMEGFSSKDFYQHINSIEQPLVTVRVNRGNQEFDLKVLRSEVQRRFVLDSKTANSPNGQVVSIRLNDFSDGASQIFLEGLNIAFKKGPVAGIVLDLRGNPGGYVHEALQILKVFLDQQPVLVYNNKGKTVVSKFDNPHPTLDIPLVVMVDEGSASASELVSGVLKAEKRAIILGTRTFGKGTAHSIVINEFGGMQLTQSFFHFTNGDSPQLRGVVPDIRILKRESRRTRASDLQHALPEQKIAPLDRSAYADANREQIFERIKKVLEKRSLQRQAKAAPSDEKSELLEAFRILIDWSELHQAAPLSVPEAS